MTPNPSPTPSPPPLRCWSEIGVWGNHSCAELRRWTHCHNCPVFSQAGRRLLEQAPPADYIREWTDLLAEERTEEAKERVSLMIFRLADEWLALGSHLFREIAENRVIHRIPHRSNNVLLGLVNIRGGLQLCLSFRELLGIAESGSADTQPEKGQRLAVVEKNGAGWVFPVDELLGIIRLPKDELQNVPVTVAKSSASFTRGIFTWTEKRVGYLDEELVFYHLKRTVL